MTDEEYVRSVWETQFDLLGGLRKPIRMFCDWFGGPGVNYFASWSAAAAFTRERLEQIRKVEQEIQLLEVCDTEELSDFGLEGWGRILAREQAALAELKRGMK